MVQARAAEVDTPGQFIDAQRLNVVAVEPFDGVVDPVRLAALQRDGLQMPALGTTQQAVKDLAQDQRCQHGNVLRAAEQPDQAHGGVEQRRVDAVDVHAAAVRLDARSEWLGFVEQAADQGRIDVQTDAHIGLFRARPHHATCHRQGYRHHQIMQRIVRIQFVRQTYFLATLNDDA